MSRVVEELQWAARSMSPVFPPSKARKGPKMAGLQYERKLAKAIPAAEHGVWWSFLDKNGPGACQTDFIFVGREYALVLEAKYTYTESAWGQLFDLYRPVVEMATGLTMLGIQICKVLTPDAKNVVYSVAEANRACRVSNRVVIHWSGNARL